MLLIEKESVVVTSYVTITSHISMQNDYKTINVVFYVTRTMLLLTMKVERF
jgi:hypothetical protein